LGRKLGDPPIWRKGRREGGRKERRDDGWWFQRHHPLLSFRFFHIWSAARGRRQPPVQEPPLHFLPTQQHRHHHHPSLLPPCLLLHLPLLRLLPLLPFLLPAQQLPTHSTCPPCLHRCSSSSLPPYLHYDLHDTRRRRRRRRGGASPSLVATSGRGEEVEEGGEHQARVATSFLLKGRVR
jgi:hypothetical protein